MDVDLLGELTDLERQALKDIQGRTNQVIFMIGQQTVATMRLYENLGQLEHEGQEVLQGIALRLGLSERDVWTVQPDGKVVGKVH